MPRLTIDNQEVNVAPGTTVLDASRKLGIDIPTLCHLDGCSPGTSCYVCVVKIDGKENLLPSCATPATDGMIVQSQSPEVLQARKTALELLLSDHLGDCIAPCQSACPAGLDIPLMIRQIATGKFSEAIATVKRDIALPAVLGRICPAPCEKACRRGKIDSPLAICLLKRFVADVDLKAARHYAPPLPPASGKKVAVVGAGPAGLAAAYYMAAKGHACTIFDDRDQPGGMLRFGIKPGRLEPAVLDAEIAAITGMGVKLQMKTRIGRDVSLADLRRDFDAVVIAVGKITPGDESLADLSFSDKGISVDPHTFQTSQHGVFAGGDAVHSQQLAVRAVADGKAIARSVEQYLAGLSLADAGRGFTTRIGLLDKDELERFMLDANPSPRVLPANNAACGDIEISLAQAEAMRCLHCDCRQADGCKLREYSAIYGAQHGRFKSRRRAFQIQADHPEIIYEPGKCISCGLCIQIAQLEKEPLGLTFVGRGFDVRVAVPLGGSLADGLKVAFDKCVRACPTGALAFKDETRNLQ
jgi:ferredoxin